MDASKFESVVKDKNVRLYHISTRDISCYITNYGARVVALKVKDAHDQYVDVVLGFSSIEDYLDASEQYHGATVGRYANRIANGTFTLNNETYQLAKNNGGNALHGGIEGFHNSVWKCVSQEEDKIIMELSSPHLHEGYPGDLVTRLTYSVSDATLRIQYEAYASQDTIINLTHHSYFNLNGEGSGTILDHTLMINSDYYTPVNENVIPTGELNMVADTPFDFSTKKTIRKDINDDHIQLQIGNGYDHNFVVNQYEKGSINLVAKAIGNLSQIRMEVWSTEPGVQFYSANHLDGKDRGKSGQKYGSREAFCLETQHFPDSPNHDRFPSTILKEGDTFHSITEYRFATV